MEQVFDVLRKNNLHQIFTHYSLNKVAVVNRNKSITLQQDPMITTCVISRIFHIKYDYKIGTCFTIDVEGN